MHFVNYSQIVKGNSFEADFRHEQVTDLQSESVLCAFKLFYNFLLFTPFMIKTNRKKILVLRFKVITTSKLSDSIVFNRAIFLGPRADEMRPKGRGADVMHIY